MPNIGDVKPTGEEQERGRYRLFVLTLGALWLILAAALVVYWEQMVSRVEVTWETATEQGTAGFRLYRREGETGEFVPVSEDHFMQSRGGPTSGATYRYEDNKVQGGKTYFYLLEEIEADGSRRLFEDDLLEYQVADTKWWRAAMIALCCLIGAAMLVAGMRKN